MQYSPINNYDQCLQLPQIIDISVCFLGLCEEVIQAIPHKVELLKTILIILTILMAFIYPALKHSRWKRVSCGTCDFSVSAGLLLHATFLILKMIYPVTNPIFWLIPAGTISIYFTTTINFSPCSSATTTLLSKALCPYIRAACYYF